MAAREGVPTPRQAAREELEATFRRTFALHPGDFQAKYEQARDSVMAAADAYALAAGEGDSDLLAAAADKLWACAKAALVVEHSLDKPYDDDPRWSPWTRWVERPAREAHDLAMKIRKRLREAPAAPEQP